MSEKPKTLNDLLFLYGRAMTRRPTSIYGLCDEQAPIADGRDFGLGLLRRR